LKKIDKKKFIRLNYFINVPSLLDKIKITITFTTSLNIQECCKMGIILASSQGNCTCASFGLPALNPNLSCKM
jgi:hypothetical protein